MPQKAKILCIDDNKSLVETMVNLLNLLDYEAAYETEAQSGLERAKDWEPDVCIIDIGLPGTDGFAVAREMRKQGLKDTRLIALTGYITEDVDRQAAQSEFEQLLTKPVDLKQLRNALAAS